MILIVVRAPASLDIRTLGITACLTQYGGCVEILQRPMWYLCVYISRSAPLQHASKLG